MELIQGTSDLTWANQFMHKRIMYTSSRAEKWLKHSYFVCFCFLFWRLVVEPFVSGPWSVPCRKGKNFKYKYIVQEYVNTRHKIRERECFSAFKQQ